MHRLIIKHRLTVRESAFRVKQEKKKKKGALVFARTKH